jgi:vitamin B12 transporter
MSKKTLTLISICALVNATAQTDSANNKLSEVVVTATKFPTKTSMTGKVVTVITKDQLEKSAGKDLSQILTEQVGIQINGANSNASANKSIYVRGAGIEYTLITIDGVPVYDPSGIGGNFDIRNLSIDLIERVEILKGSQSTLYGSDAMAGVINIITKKTSTNKAIQINGLASYGTFNNMRGNLNLQGKQNKLDYNFGYSYNKTDGISEAEATNGDKDAYKQESFQANLGYAVTDKISFKPFLRYNWVKSDYDAGAFSDDANSMFTNKSFGTGAKTELNFNKLKVNAIYSFNKIERHAQNDSTPLLDPNYSKLHFEGSEHFADVYGKVILNKNFELTLGVDYRSSTTELMSNFSGWKSVLQGDSVKQNQIAGYAALNFNKNNCNIEAGARYNHHNVYGSNWVFNFNPSYMATEDIKIFTNISSAYRTPSLYQLYSEYGNKALKPEVALTTEVGFTHYFDNKKLKLQSVLFNRRIKDAMFFFFNPATFEAQYINQDEQNDWGVEFEMQYQICDNFSVKTFYTYTEGTRTSKDASGKEVIDFKTALLRRPAHIVGINLAYQITPKLFVSSNLQWFGQRKDIDFRTFPSTTATIGSYALVDIYTEYKAAKYASIFINARNIGNTNYTEVLGYNTLGFNMYGGVRFNF